MSAKFVPYSRKFSREKTFVNFAVLWLFAQVFSAKFGSMAQQKRKFSLRKLYFSPIRESFLPQMFPAIWYFKNWYYSGTSLKGHLWNKDTWLIRTFDSVPTLIILFSFWNKDTSVIRTIILVPRVSVLETLHCMLFSKYCLVFNVMVCNSDQRSCLHSLQDNTGL